MSKCGSTIWSMTLIRPSRSLASSARRLSIVLPRSSTRLCTTWLGAGVSANAGVAVASASTQNREQRMRIDHLFNSPANALAPALTEISAIARSFHPYHRLRLRRWLVLVRTRGLVARVLRGVAATDQILADQLLELHRTLSQDHFVAVLEHVRRPARLDRNILVDQ